MPNIVYKNVPGTGTLATGATPTGLDISENWYFPSPTGEQSLEIINGHLDSVNLDSGFKFNTRHFQKNTVSRGRMVGCTANIDYFREMFGNESTEKSGGIKNEKTDAEMAPLAERIPGLGIRFYVPQNNSKCVIQWNFSQQNDAWFDTGVVASVRRFPVFFLFVDGVMDPSNVRRYTPGAYFVSASGSGSGVKYELGRSWCGHKFTTLNKGWHNADIRVFIPGRDGTSINSSREVPQCRVRTRGIRYILFK